MCCCEKPTINGEPGYRWQPTDRPSVYPVNPPDLKDVDTLLYDEPGRCGGQDSHSFHYRVVSAGYLLVRHGAGDERIYISNHKAVAAALGSLDSNGRYWLLNAIYHAQDDAGREGRAAENGVWAKAAAEGRVKIRKVRGKSMVTVWIEKPPIQIATGGQ